MKGTICEKEQGNGGLEVADARDTYKGTCPAAEEAPSSDRGTKVEGKKDVPCVRDFREDFNNHLEDLVQDVQNLSKASCQGWEYYRQDGMCETLVTPKNQTSERQHQISLSRLIGHGSSGRVYCAIVDGKEKAVKSIRVTWEDAGKVISEAEMGCSMDHPNIVKTYGYVISNLENRLNNYASSALARMLSNVRKQQGDDEEDYFYVQMIQELCKCGSLESYIGSSETPFERMHESKTTCIALILSDVARALVYLHDHGILHGDLSGNNVLLVRDDSSPLGMRAKLSDFGHSRIYQTEKMLTDSLGTANFMPPEMLLSGDLSTKCDVYAMGILGLEMWRNEKAWNGMLPVQILYAMTLGKRIRVDDSFHGALGNFLRSCLADNPTERPTPKEALDMLQSILHNDITPL